MCTRSRVPMFTPSSMVGEQNRACRDPSLKACSLSIRRSVDNCPVCSKPAIFLSSVVGSLYMFWKYLLGFCAGAFSAYLAVFMGSGILVLPSPNVQHIFPSLSCQEGIDLPFFPFICFDSRNCSRSSIVKN